MAERKNRISMIRLGYEKGQGNRRNLIAKNVTAVVAEKLKLNNNCGFSISTDELRVLVAKRLTRHFGLRTLETINAIRKDQHLSQNFNLSQTGKGEVLFFYSQALFIELETEEIKDIEKRIVANRLAVAERMEKLEKNRLLLLVA